MRLLDTYTLARTKRRTRRIRTAITILIASLLFSVLVFGVIVISGVERSATNMINKSMSGRYIVQGNQVRDFDIYNKLSQDQELVKQATDRYNKLVADKTAAAKRLGVEYDPKSEPLPYESYEKTPNAPKYLSYGSHPIATAVGDEWLAQHQPELNLDDFKKATASSAPSKYYAVSPFAARDGMLVEMKDGKEKLGEDAIKTPEPGASSEDFQEAVIAPQDLIQMYLFEQTNWQPEQGTIPIIVTQKRAETLTGLKSPGKKAPAQERLDYGEKLRQAVRDKTFSVCYRNQASVAELTKALEMQREIKAHAQDRQYQKPSLIYDLPADETACGPVRITSDTRTTEEKTYTTKLEQFNREFGQSSDPVQRKVTFQVVGMAPNTYAESSTQFSMGVVDIVSMLFSTQGFRATIPQEMYEKLSSEQQLQSIFGNQTVPGMMGMFASNRPAYYAEFTDAQSARDLVEKQSCDMMNPQQCLSEGKLFSFFPFGSNSMAIDQAIKYSGKALLWGGLAIVIFAALISGLTVARTIADSRRETAVFRAIGFKRRDIISVYVVYTLMLSLSVALMAGLIGLAGALILDNALWVDTTAQFKLLLGIGDQDVQFRFYGWSIYLLAVLGAVILSGLIGATIPLLRNIRRNPISDMRDE